ncbi:MAG: 4'-phosphopantetheinyl transferase superfamily protein [Nitrososphaeraceae archaeon]|jgi:phosphopantetheine--protein transferase-like protein
MTIESLKVGTDVIEVKRFRSKPLNDRNTGFYHSVFTKSELIYCTKFSDPYPHLAGIFAAKESIIKCLNKPAKMIDIEISHGQYGKPTAVIHRRRKTTISTRISISHTKSVAIAVAITD